MLLEKINDDLKSAMKEKKEVDLRTLRMLLSAIKNEEIAKRPNELREEDVLVVVKREIKKTKDAIIDFKSGRREDLAIQYKEELDVLEKYVPKQIEEEYIRIVVKEVISKTEEKNFGLIMKQVMAELKEKGDVDGGLVSKVLKEEL